MSLLAKVVKKRNWAFLAYPESLPANWVDVLQQTGLPFAVSPLHDKDVDPNGDIKKHHYHVILCYPGPTTYTVVKALTDSLNQPIPQPLESVKGYYRYFSHKDNPDKAQYDESQIKSYNGFDILEYSDLTAREVLELKEKVVEIIRELNINEYSTLIEYLLDNGYSQEWSIVSNHTIFFERYVASRRYRGIRATKKAIRDYWDDVEDTNAIERFYREVYENESLAE